MPPPPGILHGPTQIIIVYIQTIVPQYVDSNHSSTALLIYSALITVYHHGVYGTTGEGRSRFSLVPLTNIHIEEDKVTTGVHGSTGSYTDNVPM